MTANRSVGSNWGRWGDDDERGTLNLVDDAATRRGVAAARTGRTYALGLPIDRRGAPIIDGRGEPRRLTLTCDSDEQRYSDMGGEPGVGANQDVLILASHHGTHLDALSHVFAGRSMYNGFPSASFTAFGGASKLGVEKLGAFAGRGVLLDVATHVGVEVLAGGYAITSADLDACARRQGVELHSGDLLLVRTGWLEWWRSGVDGHPGGTQGQPGIGLDALTFIRDHDVAVVGSDNSAVEVIPFDQVFLSLHIELLVNLGVPLLEHLWLAELAADHCYEFLLCVAPLPVTGAGGSPVNPIAVA